MKLVKRFQEFHPVVYFLLLGNIFIYIGYGMIIPYFAIYLGEHTNLSLSFIGFIIGGGAFVGSLGGFFGGNLSDKYGRKAVILASLYASGILYLGFIFTNLPVLLLLLTILTGFTGAFFEPSAKALMGDLTIQSKRVKVFSYRYVATNLGFAIGPIIGIYIGSGTSSPLPFIIAGLIFVTYALFLHILLPADQKPGSSPVTSSATENKNSLKAGLQAITKDRILLYFLLGGFTVTIVLGQISVPLSQFFAVEFPDVVHFLATLWAVHSIVIIIFSIPITSKMEKNPPIYSITIGSILCSLGLICFGFSNDLPLFITAMILVTLGEIFIIPAEYGIIDQITPEDMRGTYYGSISFTNLGSFVGPGLAGFWLAKWGGSSMFTLLALITLSSLVFYFRGQNLRVKQRKSVNITVSTDMQK